MSGAVNHRRAFFGGYVPPAPPQPGNGPLAWYKASDLSGNDGDNLPQATNAGRGGSAYDLLPASSRPPVLRVTGGVKDIEFTGSDWLQSLNDFPIDAFQRRPRVLSIAYSMPTGLDYRGLCAYGQHAVTRAEFDLAQLDRGRAFALFGGAAEFVYASQTGGQVLTVIISEPNEADQTAFVQVLLNGVTSAGSRIQFDTQMQAFFMLGTCLEPSLQQGTTLRVREVLFDAPATVAQAQAYHSQVRARTGY